MERKRLRYCKWIGRKRIGKKKSVSERDLQIDTKRRKEGKCVREKKMREGR